MNIRSVNIWVAKNKDGKVSIHKTCPTRNEDKGKWVSKDPFCSSIIQAQIQKLLERSSITWESDPEYLEIQQ